MAMLRSILPFVGFGFASVVTAAWMGLIGYALHARAREATRSAPPGGGYFFLVYSRATGSLAQVAGSAERVA